MTRQTNEAAQEPDRLRVDLALGPAAGAVGPKPALADLVQDRLRDDRAGGVAGAEEQDVVRPSHAAPVPRFRDRSVTGRLHAGAPAQASRFAA
jgi:hypothetical protein